MALRDRSDSESSDASTASTGSTKSVGSDHSSIAPAEVSDAEPFAHASDTEPDSKAVLEGDQEQFTIREEAESTSKSPKEAATAPRHVRTGRDAQRESWDSLHDAIEEAVMKVEESNIQDVLPSFFRCNLVRGRGLLTMEIIRAVRVDFKKARVLAAVINVIDTKLPETGELLVKRVIADFKSGHRRRERSRMRNSCALIAQLCNASVVHELLALQVQRSRLP